MPNTLRFCPIYTPIVAMSMALATCEPGAHEIVMERVTREDAERLSAAGLRVVYIADADHHVVFRVISPSGEMIVPGEPAVAAPLRTHRGRGRLVP